MKKYIFFVLGIILSFSLYPQDISAAERLKGKDRYETAVAISKNGWSKADTVVLAIGNNFPDALAGGPLAYKKNAPILLTKKDTLGTATVQEIKRLKATKAILLGSSNVITYKVENELKSLGIAYSRIGGKDRYETASLIAAEMGQADKAIIAYGMNFPDALAAAPYAAQKGYPILLSKTNDLTSYTKKALNGVKETIFVGGTSIIKDSTMKQAPNAKRISGANRFDTASAFIKTYQQDASAAYVATGMNFADALTGSVLAAKKNGAMMLVNQTQVPKAMNNLLTGGKTFVNVYALGGDSVVSNGVLTKVEELNVNNTIQKAAQVQLNTSYSPQTSDGQYDYFKFTLKNPGNLTVQLKQQTGYTWYGEVIDKSGKVLVDLKTDNSSNVNNFLNKSVGLAAGEYYFKVIGHNDKAAYTFKINYTESDFYEKEFNDAVATATPVELNKEYRGVKNDSFLDLDYYKFAVTSPGNIELHMENKTGSEWTAIILDSNGNEYGELKTKRSSDSSGTQSFSVGLPKGTYYLKIYGGEEQVEYKFQLKYQASNFYEKEFNDSVAAANVIDLNTTYSGNIRDWYNDTDYYKFSLKEAGEINLNMKQTTGSYWTVAILTSSGTEIATFQTDGSEYASGMTAVPVGLPEGDYYVKILHGDENLQYEFKVGFTPGINFEKELNNTIQAANLIKVNSTYKGSISDEYDDTDFYTFQIESQTVVTLKMSNHPDLFWYYDITDQSGNNLLDYGTDYHDTARGEESVSINLKPGKYYLKVTGSSSTVFKPYTFSLNK